MNAPPITVVVVDDEPLALDGVANLLRRDPEIRVVAECIDGRQAVEAIVDLKPDLVLLDIQMPELDGFQVIEGVGADRMPVVVFITAYDHFAIRAFEAQALDYLVKPFDDERFRIAIRRAKLAVRRRSVEGLERQLVSLLHARSERAQQDGTPVARLVLREAGRVQFVPTREIDWIEAANYCVKIHVKDEIHLLRESMTSIADRLRTAGFFRLHKSAVVNLRRIKELRPVSGSDWAVILVDGTRLSLGRGRRDVLEATLAGLGHDGNGSPH